MERFFEGQKVVCINDHFPKIRTTLEDKSDIGKLASLHPVKGETLTVDEILGDFLRFDKYDNEAYNWWHSSKFQPIDEIEITGAELKRKVLSLWIP